MTEVSQTILTKLSESNQALADSSEDIRNYDIRNYKVRDSDGEDMGKVSDLLIDNDEGKVRFLEVQSGGIFGIGSDDLLLPVDTITKIDSDDEVVHVNQSKDSVVNAPTYDPNVVNDRPYYGSLYDYYGLAPYWAPGYAYPAFPYYR
jgi:sporulation protein YlmC with PRC-barrel domain